MIPRLGDGNTSASLIIPNGLAASLEIDSPSRGRKHTKFIRFRNILNSLEIDSPSRGRKLKPTEKMREFIYSLEIDSPSRGRKRLSKSITNDGAYKGLEIDSPSRGRKQNEFVDIPIDITV